MPQTPDAAIAYYAASFIRYFEEERASPNEPPEHHRYVWALHACDSICRQAPVLGIGLLEEILSISPSEHLRASVCWGQLVTLLNALQAHDRTIAMGLILASTRLKSSLKDVWKDGLEPHALRLVDELAS